MSIDFTFTTGLTAKGQTIHFAQQNGSVLPKFTIGNRTKYGNYYGLINTQAVPGLIYDPAHYAVEFGFWAYFLYPTAMAESKGSYLCLNTYDKAKFTFSFMQYAAHVPNGDFVKFFKKLLVLPNATDYFPKILLNNGRIFFKNPDGSLKQLENNLSTKALMDYFNPTLDDVETQEIICSARMIHWASNDAAHRRIQVETAIEHYRIKMAEYSKLFHLDGVPAKVCLMVSDIRHQGRGVNPQIAQALNTGGNYEQAFSNLCSIGADKYLTRINTVKATIEQLLAAGVYQKKYDAASGTFVAI